MSGNQAVLNGQSTSGGWTSATYYSDELMKQKYRDALAHKHGTSGAKKTAHGDKGEEAHSQSAGPTQKMFRRKAGG